MVSTYRFWIFHGLVCIGVIEEIVFINYIVTQEQKFVKWGRKVKQQKLPDILTAAQAAAFLRVGRSTTYQLIAAGELESIPVHGHHRIPAKSVRKFMRKTSAKAL